MRRVPFLLSIAASAAAFLAPAAHADPVCAIAWIDGTAVPYVTTGPTCMSYPYDVGCQWDTVGVSPDVLVHSIVCFPQVLATDGQRGARKVPGAGRERVVDHDLAVADIDRDVRVPMRLVAVRDALVR